MQISRRTIAATALVLAGGAAAFAAVPATTAAMGWDEPGMMMPAGHAGHRLGRHGDMGPGPALCAPERSRHVDDVIGLVESFVTFRPDQQGPWTTLRDSVKAASGRLDAACAANRAEGPPDTPPAQLARIERIVTAEAQGLQEIRPALDAFYATLDAQQKAALEKVLPMGRPHRG